MKTAIISTLMLLLSGLLTAQQTPGKPGAVAAASTGAATWNGLRFGMTEAEANLALHGKFIPDHYEPPEKTFDTYNGGRVEGLDLHGLGGTADLLFNKKSKKLVSVEVFFDPKGPELQEQSPVVGLVRDEFVKKYGRPTLSRGLGPDGCDKRISDSCEIIFHSAGQSIHVSILVSHSSVVKMPDYLISIKVTYEPLGANSAI
jgi:hypothetical protein